MSNGVSVSQIMPLQEGIQTIESATAEAIKTAQEAGFYAQYRPEAWKTRWGERVPDSIFHLADGDLADLMLVLDNLWKYEFTQQAIADVQLNNAKSRLSFVMAHYRVALRTQRKKDEESFTVDEINDETKIQREVVVLQETVHYQETLLAIISNSAQATKQSWSTVSRHLTQRMSGTDSGRRNHNVVNFPSAPPAQYSQVPPQPPQQPPGHQGFYQPPSPPQPRQ